MSAVTPLNREIVIVGFPKCGTTALVRALEKHPTVDVLTTPGGSYEFVWPHFRDQPRKPDPDRIRVHKYTAYTYIPANLAYLARHHPTALYVLCVRQSLRSLVSWHRMHQQIALSDRPSTHFAYRERDFYATCTVAEYYDRYAASRLRYKKHLQDLTKVIAPANLAVVSQERMSSSLPWVASVLVQTAQGLSPDLTVVDQVTTRHKGYADAVDLAVPEQIVNDLHRVDMRLRQFLRDLDCLKLV